MSRLQHQLTCQFQLEELIVTSDRRKFPLRRLSLPVFHFSSFALHPEYALGSQGGCCIPSRIQTLWCYSSTAIPIQGRVQKASGKHHRHKMTNITTHTVTSSKQHFGSTIKPDHSPHIVTSNQNIIVTIKHKSALKPR